MIISKFNKYVEKHGRTTYIVLGIIICLAFVIFVTPDSAGFGGCSGPKRIKHVGKMYGKKISLDDFMLMKRQTDIDCYMRYGMFLSQYNEEMLNRETLNRLKMVREAKKRGYYKNVTDQDVASKIQNLSWLQDENKKFSVLAFNNFKNNFLKSYNLTAGDFDNMMRDSIAIERMTEEVMSSAQVTEAEIDGEVAEYSVSFAELNMDVDKDSAPSQAEIQDFFDKRKAEVPVEKVRSAFTASFSIDDNTALAAKADAPAKLKQATAVSDDEAQRHYDASKDRLYKGKSFIDVKIQIVKSLQSNKIRAYTRTQAVDLNAQIKKAVAGLEAAAAVAKFQELAKAAGAKVTDTGLFSSGNTFANQAGNHPQLANAIRTLNTKGALYENVVMDGRNFAIAMLGDIQPGKLPEKLDDETSGKIIEAILNEKALAYYNSTIAPYKDLAKGTKSSWELGRKEMENLRNNPDLSPEQQQARWTEYSQFLSDNVYPFYRQEMRSFSAAVLNSADYEKEINLSDAEIEKGYEDRKAEFQKVEVKLAKILVKAAKSDTDEVKNARKARADEVYAKLIKGEDFAKLAAEYSDDEASKNNGGATELVDVESLEAPVKEQLAKMSLNQLSPIVGTAEGHLIFKLLEKTAPKALADVRGQLVQTLTKEAAQKAAMEEAEKIYQAVTLAWNEAGHAADQRFQLLKNAVAGTKATIVEAPMTQQNNYLSKGAAADRGLMAKVFDATIAEPFTAAVQGTDAAYVACLNEVQEAYLEDAKDRMSTLLSVYKRTTAMATLLARAKDLAGKGNAALKAGTELAKISGDIAFKAANGKLGKKTATQFTDFNVRNITDMLSELGKVSPKFIIPPQRTYTGYVLVCLDDKKVPQGDEAKSLRDAAKEQLLTGKKQALFSNFMQQVDKDANVTDLHPAVFGNKQ